MNSINPQETTQELVRFIKRSFDQARFVKAVIAVSGGIDSATSCALTVQALGKENVFSVLLPYKKLNERGVIDATQVVQFLQIPKQNISQIDIGPLVDPAIALDPGMEMVRQGNIMARVRMIVVYDLAKKQKALVVGTENKSEHLLGYFTRFGDEASDVEPLRNLYKTQVYELARYLGLPEVILTKKPTAGLWEGQTDEGDFGFSYKDADEILSLFYDEKKSVDEIVAMGWQRDLVDKVRYRVQANGFKHHLPIIS